MRAHRDVLSDISYLAIVQPTKCNEFVFTCTESFSVQRNITRQQHIINMNNGANQRLTAALNTEQY